MKSNQITAIIFNLDFDWSSWRQASYTTNSCQPDGHQLSNVYFIYKHSINFRLLFLIEHYTHTHKLIKINLVYYWIEMFLILWFLIKFIKIVSRCTDAIIKWKQRGFIWQPHQWQVSERERVYRDHRIITTTTPTISSK